MSEKERRFKETFPEGTIEEILHGKGGTLLSRIDEIVLRRLWGIDPDTPIECQQTDPNSQILCYAMGWNVYYNESNRRYSNFENPLWSVLGSRDSAQWLSREREMKDWPSAKEMTELFDAFGEFLESQEEMREAKEGIDRFKDEFPIEWTKIEKEMRRDASSKEKFEEWLLGRWGDRKRMEGRT